MTQGILVASDHNTEWLLPWWWDHFCKYNKTPVAFVDFGMSKEMMQWCRARGMYISLDAPKGFVQDKDGIHPKIAKKWEKIYRGEVWKARQAWFKKPLACLKTPFDLTLWLDLDCEVCGSLKPLFDEWEDGVELGIVQEDEEFIRGVVYNSGVMLFKKSAPFLKTWADLCLTENGNHLGDQNILTHLILSEGLSIKSLSPTYNWMMYKGANPFVTIVHWVGGWGKEYIQKFGGLHQLVGEPKDPNH